MTTINPQDVAERCREHLTMSKFLRKEDLLARASEDRALAADTIEALKLECERLAGIIADHCRAVNTLTVDGARLQERVESAEAERDALAAKVQKMEAVVEVAREYFKNAGLIAYSNVRRAISTLDGDKQ